MFVFSRNPNDSEAVPIEFARIPNGGCGTGFMENGRYLVRIEGDAQYQLFVDDVPLDPVWLFGTRYFSWSPDFYAGQVNIVAQVGDVDVGGATVDVSPHPGKLGRDEFYAMVSEVATLDPLLLLGETSAGHSFGHATDLSAQSPEIRYARLVRYGLPFLKALGSAMRERHEGIHLERVVVPASKIRRVYPATLRGESFLRTRTTVAGGSGGSVSDADPLVPLRLPRATTDTAANRAVKALCLRFCSVVARVLASFDELSRLDTDEAFACRKRLPRRRKYLSLLLDECRRLVRSSFPLELRAEVTGGGLTQVHAYPPYAKAYRLGCRAIGTGVGAHSEEDLLALRPTWGIYEIWCFARLKAELDHVLSPATWERVERGVASADLTYAAEISEAKTVQLLYQANFPATNGAPSESAISVSKNRVPDIVLALNPGKVVAYVILDAKYRSGPLNIRDAMESAHIYHDSLRLGGAPPQLCLLLLPGEPEVAHLHSPAFRAHNGVGAIPRFRVGADGIQELLGDLKHWLFAPQQVSGA